MANKLKAWLKTIGINLVIALVMLVIIDVMLMATGLYPPKYQLGHPELGWATRGPDDGRNDACIDFESGQRVDYRRNELGIRTTLTPEQIREKQSALVIAAVGDSHSDLCALNAETHQGVLETELTSSLGETIVLSNGVGRYSPLQAYLLFQYRLEQFAPDVLVLNLYTGNDFIDILRSDDRPHFVPSESGDYEIAEPRWLRYYDPDKTYRSRVLFVVRDISKRLGISQAVTRLRQLSSSTDEFDASFSDLYDYIQSIQASVEPSLYYPAALSAQFLNQQLFFHHFEGSDDEALRRVDHLLAMIRKENPELLLVLSPIPSYQLAAYPDIDTATGATLDRLPISIAESVDVERRLYEQTGELARQNDWLFVDNLSALLSAEDRNTLYNKADYHLTPAASKLIGDLQAEKIREAMSRN